MRLVAAIFFCVGLALLAQAPDGRYQRPAPVQPLPFSHLKHAGELKVACAECHPIPGNGDFATLPATTKCMGCHISIKKDSPHIQKLAGWHAEGAAVRWAPVYRIPNYVSFNHRKHVSVEGVNCGTCHGPVAEREVLRREKDISMAACMDCHRSKGASNECLLCHDQR